MSAAIVGWNAADLIAAMEAAGLPGGKVNEIPEVLEHPQIKARGLVHEIERSDGTPVKFLGFPAKMSVSPADYRHAPPRSGEDTIAILADQFGLTKSRNRTAPCSRCDRAEAVMSGAPFSGMNYIDGANRAGRCFHYYAGEIVRAQGEWYNSMREGHNVVVPREPVGVVAAINRRIPA